MDPNEGVLVGSADFSVVKTEMEAMPTTTFGVEAPHGDSTMNLHLVADVSLIVALGTVTESTNKTT